MDSQSSDFRNQYYYRKRLCIIMIILYLIMGTLVPITLQVNPLADYLIKNLTFIQEPPTSMTDNTVLRATVLVTTGATNKIILSPALLYGQVPVPLIGFLHTYTMTLPAWGSYSLQNSTIALNPPDFLGSETLFSILYNDDRGHNLTLEVTLVPKQLSNLSIFDFVATDPMYYHDNVVTIAFPTYTQASGWVSTSQAKAYTINSGVAPWTTLVPVTRLGLSSNNTVITQTVSSVLVDSVSGSSPSTPFVPLVFSNPPNISVPISVSGPGKANLPTTSQINSTVLYPKNTLTELNVLPATPQAPTTQLNPNPINDSQQKQSLILASPTQLNQPTIIPNGQSIDNNPQNFVPQSQSYSAQNSPQVIPITITPTPNPLYVNPNSFVNPTLSYNPIGPTNYNAIPQSRSNLDPEQVINQATQITNSYPQSGTQQAQSASLVSLLSGLGLSVPPNLLNQSLGNVESSSILQSILPSLSAYPPSLGPSTGSSVPSPPRIDLTPPSVFQGASPPQAVFYVTPTISSAQLKSLSP